MPVKGACAKYYLYCSGCHMASAPTHAMLAVLVGCIVVDNSCYLETFSCDLECHQPPATRHSLGKAVVSLVCFCE